MRFGDHELRKALDARSGDVTPEFRARLRQSLVDSAPQGGWMPAIALATAIALTVTSVGVLVAARQFMGSHGSAASGPRVTTPTPSATMTQGSIQVSAPSTRVVWALVNYDHLYRSTDQGVHWEQRSMPTQSGVRPSISFLNDQEGWLLAPGSPITQCGAQLAHVWHTTDGGATWQDLGARIDKTQCKNGIWFSDARHGFVTAWDPDHPPTVYRTSDAGEHWSPSTLPDPPDFKTLPGGFSLQVEWIKAFGSTLYLEAFGSQGPGTPYPQVHDRQYVFTSTNGGATWAWKQKVPSRTMALVTESRWLEVIAPNRMDESLNGGQQFHWFQSDLASNISAADVAQLVFADERIGYATVGSNLQRTLDGGSHWVAISTSSEPAVQPSPTPQIILPTTAQISAPSIDVVWVLIDGYLFRSVDQGATWEQRNWIPHQGGGGIPVISFVDDRHGWALLPGAPGTQCQQAGAQLWRTSDGATTWEVVASVTDQTRDPKAIPFDQCKEYTAFVDATTGFIAGHDTTRPPIISRTLDGGATWTPSTLPNPPGLKADSGISLQVVNLRAFTGILLATARSSAGAEYVFRSTDGGASWSYLAPSAGNAYRPINFVTESRWLLIGNDGSGEETADAGSTWHAFTCDYRDAAGVSSTFVFASAQVGYGTVRGGIQRTVDGGLHWVRLRTPGVVQPG